MTTRYDRIAEWLECWERVSSNPAEAILGRSVPNLIDSLLPKLRDRAPGALTLASKGWLYERLRELKKAFDRDDPSVRLLSVDHPIQIAALRNLLNAGSGSSADFAGALEVLQRGPSGSTLENNLRSSLRRMNRPSEKGLYVVTALLFRRALTLHTPAFLTKLPFRVLSRACFEARLPLCESRLSNDPNVNQVVRNIVRNLENSQELADELSSFQGRGSLHLLDLFRRLTWSSDVYQALRVAVRECLDPIVSSPATQGWIISREVISRLITSVVSSAVRHLVDQSTDRIRTRGFPSLDNAGNAIGDTWTACGFANQRGPSIYRPTLVDSLSSAALTNAISATIGEVCAESLESSLPPAFFANLTDAFRTALSASGCASKYEELNEIQRYRCVAELASDRRFQEAIWTSLLPVAMQISGQLRRSMQGSFWPVPNNTSAFWKEWSNQIRLSSGGYDDLFHWCPWDDLSAAEFRSVLRTFCQTLGPTDDLWAVIGDVDGLHPEGKTWQLGGVTFYDPALQDFGEGTYLGRNRTTSASSLLGSHVIVQADSAQLAEREAHNAIRGSLDVLSAAVRKRTRGGSITSSISPATTVLNLSRRFWSGSWQMDMGGSHPIRRAVGDALYLFEQERPRVAALAAVPLAHPTDLRRRLVRTIRRFREGNWAASSITRLLEYWIGLEQLFEGGKDADDTIRRAAACSVTWRDVDGVCLSSNWRRKLRDRVRRMDPTFEQFAGPLTAYAVVLNVLPDGVRTTVTGSADARALFRLYLDPPPQVEWDHARPYDFTPAIVAEVSYKRERKKFALYRLYELRNEIVHEALPYRVDAQVLARELERLLEDVINKILRSLELTGPEPSLIAQVQSELDSPWM